MLLRLGGLGVVLTILIVIADSYDAHKVIFAVPLILIGWVFIEIRKRKAGQKLSQPTRTTEFTSLEAGARLMGDQRQWWLAIIAGVIGFLVLAVSIRLFFKWGF